MVVFKAGNKPSRWGVIQAKGATGGLTGSEENNKQAPLKVNLKSTT